VKDHPTFRERSEVPDLSFEISMQPYRRYKVDGVILFSDILTPLPGMNIEFDILEKAGPVIREPYRTQVRRSNFFLVPLLILLEKAKLGTLALGIIIFLFKVPERRTCDVLVLFVD